MALLTQAECAASCAILYIPGTAAYAACVDCCLRTGLGAAFQTPENCRSTTVAAFPSIGAEQACKTKQHGKGVCCRALTTLGETRMAEGFTYTDCSGVLRCARCWVVPSKSIHHSGRHVFKYRGAPGCGGGCPQLATAPLSPQAPVN